jgi:tetraacyldisaccharide 4'-kinase
MAIASEAHKRGYQVGIVSRGYGVSQAEKVKRVKSGQRASEIGDEPAEMVAALPHAKIALSSNRILASEALIAEGVNFIIADDGFQNLNFKADLTVLAVTDADRDEVPYRDFDSAYRGADFIVQTKGKNSGRFGPVHEIHWDAAPAPSGPLWIWCALGDPEEVVSFYRDRGYRIDRVIRAHDHAVPEPEEFEALIKNAAHQGARVAVTPKDAVKLRDSHREKVFLLRRTLNAPELLSQIFQRLQ